MFVKRYRITELRDGRLLALDKTMAGALLLTPKPANGEYTLSRSGALQIRAGAIVSLKLPAESTGYRVEPLRGGGNRVVRIAEPAWELRLGGPGGGLSASHAVGARFAILDLKPRGYLLAKSDGIVELVAGTALNGRYPAIDGSTITVRNGTTAASTGGSPIYQYADDFAP